MTSLKENSKNQNNDDGLTNHMHIDFTAACCQSSNYNLVDFLLFSLCRFKLLSFFTIS